MPLNVLYTDSKALDLDVERGILGADAVLVNARKSSMDEVDPAALESCDALVVNRLNVGPDTIARLARCRLVVRNGVGFDVVDLEACGNAGIVVCNCPDYGTTDVADSAIAMMMTFARGTAVYDATLRADLKTGWSQVHNVASRRLAGACFGVIGLGRIGTAAALRARALGMEVAFYDPHLKNGVELSLGFRRARKLHELLGMADVVSIHADLNQESRNLIDEDAVAAMKPGAYLLNAARGPVCDTTALLAGLRSGRLLAVGLDVLPEEPATLADPLVAAWHANEPWIRGRVLLSPHAAGYSPAAFADLRRKVAETVLDFFADSRAPNCVNTEFLKRRR